MNSNEQKVADKILTDILSDKYSAIGIKELSQAYETLIYASHQRADEERNARLFDGMQGEGAK